MQKIGSRTSPSNRRLSSEGSALCGPALTLWRQWHEHSETSSQTLNSHNIFRWGDRSPPMGHSAQAALFCERSLSHGRSSISSSRRLAHTAAPHVKTMSPNSSMAGYIPFTSFSSEIFTVPVTLLCLCNNVEHTKVKLLNQTREVWAVL